MDIWDTDFVDLTMAEQLVYFMLVSSKDLSYCGVAPLLPKRLRLLASDMTERKARAALEGLAAKRYLVLDETTDEALVRTYIKHDGILKQPNMIRAMTRAFDRVHSEPIRKVIRFELGKALGEGFPDGFPEGIAKALQEGFPEGLGEQRYHSPSPFPLPPSNNSSAQNLTKRAREVSSRADLGETA